MERSRQYLQIGLVMLVVFLALVLFSVLRALASTWLRASR
ncbi:MAG: hypothetical protein RLZZ387_1205, partial [Chloroflexota bacterium]